MSTVSDALEAEVAAIRHLRASADDAARAQRSRAAIDRHFARLLRLIAPRIRHFTRAYGLLDHAEDAGQACAIGLLRAIEAYDPLRARFTTFVNWQLRGELQALRFRLRSDARGAARRLGALTVSLDELLEDDTATAWQAEDHEALERTEALAAETLARRACGRLLDDHFAHLHRIERRRSERRAAPRGPDAIKPGTVAPQDLERMELRLRLEREIVTAHLLGEDEVVAPGSGLTSEQRRQIARRTLRALSDRARGNPRFDPEALVLDLPASTSRH